MAARAMSQFLTVLRHAPNDCPIVNERARKIYLDFRAKMPDLSKKDGIKVLGIWGDIPGHTEYAAFEAPSFDALQKFFMEPEVMKLGTVNTEEIKPVLTADEAYRLLE